MFGTFLIKDLKRARANPWPYLIFLILPVCTTGLIGLIFGPQNDEGSGKLAKIKLAIVDEDRSPISETLRSAFSQGDAQEHIEADFLEMEAARRRIENNQISAILVIPEHFMDDYLSGEKTRPLRVIKNPAQTIYPGIVEQLIQVVAEALSAISVNFGEEFGELRVIMEKEGRPDLLALAAMISRIGTKFEKAEDYLFPPLVTYADSADEAGSSSAEPDDTKPGFNIFAFLLPMMSSMFLLWMADGAMRDIYREVRGRTFDRFRTLNSNVLFFTVSKVVFAWMVVLIGGCFMFTGGGLLFGIDWNHPLQLCVIVVAFAFCSTGLVMFLIALARNERRSDTLNSVVIMGMSFIGGSMFDVRAIPAFLRDFVSPCLPNYWFIQAFQKAEFDAGQAVVAVEVAKLMGVGIGLILISTWILNQCLRKGLKP